MNFLINEYISLLKEDGELDALLIDILNSKGIIPLSKPQKGRQYGVDISAVGIDEDGIKKLFLITVKQGDITRAIWDKNQNSVRQSLNEIKDVYIPTLLTNQQNQLPKKVIVATNGILNQALQITWANFTKLNENENLKYDFWGIDAITKMVSENFLSERLFDSEIRLLLKKTLAFLELKDYNLSHYNSLVDVLTNKPLKTKKPLLKRLKLIRICLNIVFKWSVDNGYIKSAIYAADKTILKVYEWLCLQNHFEKKFIKIEFYRLHSVRREIGIKYFNKVSKHYFSEHSIQRYSRNQIEYNLTIWEEIGILGNIGLTEIKHYQFHYDPNNLSIADFYEESAMNIAKALISLIDTNPTSKYPMYDDHLIDIEPALRFLYFTGNKDACKKWIRSLAVGIHDAKVIKDFFPLFRSDYENLVDIYTGLKKQDEKSSMLLTLLIDWAVLLNSQETYDDIKNIIQLFDNKMNLQIWFPKKDSEDFYLKNNYSRLSGSVKHSITLYNLMKDYKQELLEEVEKLSLEKEFKSISIGYDLLFSITSRYHRELPFPYLWRRLVKEE